MAYINVAEWTSDQVTDWLKGLDNSMYKYINSFANNDIKGQTLLNIRPYELNELGVTSIGHQEIVLEAVEQLRNFNYDLEKENLQFLALRVATTAKNLHHQLAHYPDKSKIETQILNDITRAIGTIKPLVGWLDRSPFQGQLQFNEIRKRILQLGIEMAYSAQRDRFVENPVDQIRLTAEKLSKLADYIIQDISDPIILQPATLNLVSLKKRESELGFNIAPNYHGIHVITDIKYNSPAHISGKIEDGDEIIQINYQTVVGWHYKRVLQQLQESPPDVLLTLKKRPRHTKIYGQIYMKPYRLPSKKRYRFGENLPSPRIEFIPSRNFPVLLPLAEKSVLTDSDSSSSSSILISAETTKSNEKDIRLYLSKPRAVLQRRNTICGDHFSGFKGNITFWHEMNVRRNIEGNSLSLRDKSVSFGFGLERPITCIGIGHNNEKFGDLANNMKGSLPDMKSGDNSNSNDVNDNMIPSRNEIKSNLSDEIKSRHDIKAKVVKFQTSQNVVSHLNESNEDYEIKNFIGEKHCKQIEVPNLPIKLKHKDEDKPPEIGPRKEFLKKLPAPKPPPRPSKAAEIVKKKLDILKNEREREKEREIDKEINKSDNMYPIPLNAPCEPYGSKCIEINQSKVSEISTNVSILDITKKNDETETNINTLQPSSPSHSIILSKHSNAESIVEETELLTPNRTKTLTLKKKNSMLAKRRKIGLKTLEFSDIQGHLFRRTKDKHGVTYWAKLYFVLIETALYGFRTKKSEKANCLIFLPGFTISLAKEVHSKPFAYKVYHPKKTFYFAAESQEALSQWMDYIKRATLKGVTSNIDPMLIDRIDNKDLFSETDSSENESELTNGDTPQPILFRKSILGTGNKSTKKRNQNDELSPITTNSKSEKYHLGFGSLKKFTNLHNLPFSSNKSDKEREERKKGQSDIPVPTAQYKSYRKISGNVGMQLGQSNMIGDYSLMTQRLQQSHVRPNSSSVSHNSISEEHTTKTSGSGNEGREIKSIVPTPSSTSINISTVQDDITISLGTAQNLTKSKLQMTSNGFNIPLQSINHESKYAENKSTLKLSKSKTSPFNYMHASNPNLVEFAFQTSKNLDVGMPKLSNAFDQHQNLQGLITLKDLMLQREEDEAHNMYNNRVNLGIEKPNDRYIKRKNRRPNEVTPNENIRTTDCAENIPQIGQKPSLSKIQRRSLPRTPDYAQSFKTDDTEIIMARSKEGQKLRDFGYEFISGGDDNVNFRSNGINNTTTSFVKPAILAKPSDRFNLPPKKKGLNWMGLTRSDEDKIIGKGNIKISKQKNQEYGGGQSCGGDVNRNKSTDSVSCPSNEDRKGSAASTHSYLSKLTFPTKTIKEKRLLGSPRLHRAASSIFGRKNIENSTYEQQNTRSFVDIDENNGGSRANATTSAAPISRTVCNSETLNEIDGVDSVASNFMSFQNIQFPPVFVPETYSLRDPKNVNSLNSTN